MKIDAHVQFNGSNYQTYMSYQPGLKCETPDHQTCKIVSVHLQAEEDKKSQEQKDAEAAGLKAQVDEAARLQARDLFKERIDEAGRMKWDAQRVAGVRKTVALNEAQAKATARKQKAIEAAALEDSLADQELKAGIDAAVAAHIEETRTIEATDWLGKIPDPAAELSPAPKESEGSKPAPEGKPTHSPEAAG